VDMEGGSPAVASLDAQAEAGLLLPEAATPAPARGPSLRAGLGALVIGTAVLAGVVAVARVATSSPGFAAARSGDTVSLVAHEEHPVVSSPCSMHGENCVNSHCCIRGGMKGLQCYQKFQFWASCLDTCEPGLHPGEYDGKEWTCAKLGNRSLPEPAFCPKLNENCIDTPCCISGGKKGLQCFAANSSYAVCAENCITSKNNSCTPLGARSAPAEEYCPEANENCLESKCCAAGGSKGLQCYQKDQYWATCLASCEKGVHEGEEDKKPWSCNELGVRSSPAAEFCPTPKQNCKDHRCCAPGGPNGLQCFEKDKYFAMCRETCDPTLDGEKWSCKPLGIRSAPDPCSAPGENCNTTKCCSASRGGLGMTCFKKDKTWSSCQETCDSSNKGWNCTALGNRTRFDAGCSWAGKDCSKTACCNNVGYTCAVQDEQFAGCTQTTLKTTWVTKQIPIPAWWNGKVLGGGRAEYEVAAAQAGQAVAGTTLYCFMAILPNTTEENLMYIARNNNASIFGCDAHAVFHSWRSGQAGWDTGTSTLVNTDVFINVWEQVRKARTFVKYDWTVKVDADCVMAPARMRSHLAALKPPAYTAIYIKNNGMDPGMGNDGFLGAVEIFSKRAVQVYFDNAAGCKEYFGLNCGEDGFFKGCMDALGIGFMKDEDIFFPDRHSGACSQGQRVAFHPLKKPEQWQHCWDIVTGKKPY